jgi:DNA-binding response OmpR family regulator
MMNSNGQHSQNNSAPEAAAETRFRTLVVDGHFFLTGFLEKFLEVEGHVILTATSVKEALAKTRQFQPDLILLDGGLDGVQGLELLGELLIEQASAAVVVLARTPSIAEAVEAIKMGALDYLDQPLDLQKLKQAIETQKLLTKSQASDQD